MKKIAALLVFFTLLPACSRKSEKTALVDAPLALGPSRQDQALTLHPLSPEAAHQHLRLEAPISTASYLRFAEDLKSIAAQQSSSAAGKFANRLVRALYTEPQPTTKLADSLYLTAILGEGESAVRPELDTIAKEIKSSLRTLSQLLDKSKTAYPWPTALPNLMGAIAAVDNYALWLVGKIGEENLSPSISQPVRAAIKSEYEKRRPGFVKAIDRLQRSRSLGQGVQAVKLLSSDLGIDLGANGRQQIKQAERLSQSLAATKTAQDALSLIIQVWRMIPANERREVFASQPEIYEFLHGKDNASLDCLATYPCLNPVLALAKRIAILPKISGVGVDKICSEIDAAALDYLLDNVRAQAASSLPDIPDFVKQAILQEGKKYQDLVESIRRDFPGFTRKRFDRWAHSNFPEPIRGLEANELNLRLSSSEEISVKLKPSARNSVESGAETVGLSLALAQDFLPEKRGAKRAALLAPITKLLAVTGFRQPGGKTFPSLLFALDGPAHEPFEIKNLLRGKITYALPDVFTAKEGFRLVRESQTATASVGAQAELLRGISRQIRFHRDWEKNLFDEELGQIQVEDIISEVPKGAVNFSAFPKDVVFALAVGAAGSILQNVILELSPAFLMLQGKEILWGNDYEQIGPDKISTVAGLVNIENGQRGRTVRTADIARYILALDEFLAATEGIENTKAAPLLEKSADGRTVLDQLLEARRYLGLFQMGLTNFLVHVAADKKDGGFHSRFTLDGQIVANYGQRDLTDQVLAIRALVATAARLNLPIYYWTALDGFYFLNRYFWDNQTQFYANAIDARGTLLGKSDALTIAATLRGLEELAPHMTGDSRAQWRRIAQPWLRALDEF